LGKKDPPFGFFDTPVNGSTVCSSIPVDYSVPVRVKTGYNEDSEPQLVPADEKGINRIEIKEVERIQIHLTDSMSPHSFSGYLEVNNCLKPLPIGSTLDTQRGIFYWQPGPGFIGDYRFVFIEKEQHMNRSRKNIVVKIVPASVAQLGACKGKNVHSSS
jgi:hypothetical protein